MGNHAARFYGQMNLVNPAKLRGQKGGNFQKVKSMKIVNHIKLNYQLFGLIIPLILLCSLAEMAYAQLPPGWKGGPTNAPLDSWSFNDHTNWTSDLGYQPVSFTNLNFSYLGNGRSLVVDTNVPAWLQYNVYENDGTTNLTLDSGSVTFWYAPGDWSSTNAGGTGPGEWGRLFEVGTYTPDSSYGLWSIYVDDGGNNIYFSAQTNDLSSSLTTYFSAPISWTTNYFHFVAVTYSATNTALYLDGVLITNGPGVTVYPGLDVLTNGFIIGSDNTGLYQANGMFNTVETYNYPLNSNDVQTIFNWNYTMYEISPWNTAMANIVSAPSNPSTSPTPDVITGAGYLQWDGSVTPIYSTNANQVWITNVTATAAGSNTENVTFTIQGGQAGYYYDVFATGALQSPITNAVWFWMGQGNSGNTYTLPITSANAFIILGTPQDTDGDGLTDAYELLVSHTDPNNAYSNLDGILDGWETLLGLNPQMANFTSPNQRANYGYTPADWLNGVSGVRSGTIGLDYEGNVQSVSQ
jgi:hypothetical protein